MPRAARNCLFVVVLFASGALYLTVSVRNTREWILGSFISDVNINLNMSPMPISGQPNSLTPNPAIQKSTISKSTIQPSTISSASIRTSTITQSTIPASKKAKSAIPTSTTTQSTIPTITLLTAIPGSSNSTNINWSRTHSSSSIVHPGIGSITLPDKRINTESFNKKTYFERIPAQVYRVTEVDCAALFKGDQSASNNARRVKNTVGSVLTDEFYMNATTDCEAFQVSRGYVMSSLTDEEQNFPIAYSLVVYKDSEMVERLLRAVYRPQNYYCIHVDLKANESFHSALEAIAQCFPNVFISNKKLKVEWGTFTVLESELICMEELWRYKKWKYFINLTGQEFPLKTNFELVKILQALKGANSINGTIKDADTYRWSHAPPLLGMQPLKGSVHITANRDFVDYILHNDTAHALLEWTKLTKIPDETFLNTLNFNPQLGIKGSFKGDPANMGPFISRYKLWHHLSHLCAGHLIRGVCILGLGDLPRLGAAVQMFANKFFLWEDRVVIGCLEEKLFNDTRDEYLGIKQFNDSFYGGLNFVTDQVT